MSKKTMETKVAETILQKLDEVNVGGKTYTIAPPSTATLILVSETVSKMPQVTMDDTKIMEESLKYAKDFGQYDGEKAAILILGARHHKETVKTQEKREKRRFFGIFKTYEEVEVETVVDRKAELVERLLNDIPPKELHALVALLLRKMQVADFFALTTFLVGINIIQPTKVGTEATASGQ